MAFDPDAYLAGAGGTSTDGFDPDKYLNGAPVPVVPGNIDVTKRPMVHNADGSISTVRSMSFEENGHEILIPTVAADGSGILSNADSIKQYHDTGQHLGVFKTPAEATQYADYFHKLGEQQIASAKGFDPDKYLSGSPYAAQEIQQAADQQAIEAAAGAAVPPLMQNAGTAAVETASGLIPRSVAQALKMVTPVASLPQEANKVYQSAMDLIAGKSVDEAVRRNYPESMALSEAEKTPPGSVERFKAGFDMLAQVGMVYGGVKGLAHAGAEVRPLEAAPEAFNPAAAGPETPTVGEVIPQEPPAAATPQPVPPEPAAALTPQGPLTFQPFSDLKPPSVVESGVLPVSPPEMAAAATAAPPARAADLKPALRTIIEGQPGQTHSNIYDAQPDPMILRASDPEHGFVDKAGNFKTRQEAAALIGETTPLQSERLIELQKAMGAAIASEKNQRDLFTPEVARQKAMNAAAAAEGPSIQALGLRAGAGQGLPFITEDVIPKIKTIGHGIATSLRQIRNIFSPASAGLEAHRTAGIIRENAAELARKQEMSMAHLSEATRLFKRTSNTFNLDVINRMEKGLPMGNAGLDAYKASRRIIFDEKIAEVRAVNPDALQNLITDYFEHIWTKDSVETLRGNAAAIDESNPWAVIFGKRPLEGSKAFLKQRSIPDTITGIALGLEPVTYNPVELDVMKLHEMDRYVMGQKIIGEMKDSGLTKFGPAGAPAPHGYTQIEDRMARVFAPKNWKIVDDTGAERPGQKLLGNLYAPDDVARVINNYLSPGLKGIPIYDAFRFLGNAMNQVQLGISLYHATFTAIDAATSTMDLGLRQVLRSGGSPHEIARGTYNIARSLVQAPVGGGLIENVWRGNKFLREYSRPGSSNAELARIVDAAVAGGARVRMDTFYKTGALHSFFEAIRKGNYPGALLRAPFAAFDAMAKPLMEWTVPRMKAGIISLNLADELRRLPASATREDIRTIAGRIVDSVDNRMGQMVYDNLFWNKTLKDGLMASVRSVGWNVGDIRELGGGALDTLTAPVRIAQAMRGPRGIAADPIVTMRMGYMFSLPLLVGALGAMYQYLATGKGPDDMVDLFMPKTGRLKPDGSPERVMLPTYIKDIAPLALAASRKGVRGLVTRAVAMGSNKLHPALNTLAEMWKNKDYYGVEIANSDDNLVTWAKKEAAFVAKQFTPFSVRGYQQREGGAAQKVQGVIGIMPTPQELTATPAEELAREIHIAKLPQGARTQEQADLSGVARDLTDEMRKLGAGSPQFKQDWAKALKAGQVRPDQFSRLIQRAQLSPLQYHLQQFTADEAMRVWNLATPAERADMKPAVMLKVVNSKTITPQQKMNYLQTVRAQPAAAR